MALRLVDITVEQLMVSGLAFILSRLRGQELSFCVTQIYHQHPPALGKADELWDPWGSTQASSCCHLHRSKWAKRLRVAVDMAGLLGFEGLGGGFPTPMADLK